MSTIFQILGNVLLSHKFFISNSRFTLRVLVNYCIAKHFTTRKISPDSLMISPTSCKMVMVNKKWLGLFFGRVFLKNFCIRNYWCKILDRTSGQYRGVGRHASPHSTTKRIQELQLNLKTNNTQNCQKIKLYGGPTNKDLKKPQSSRWGGGVEMWRHSGEVADAEE